MARRTGSNVTGDLNEFRVAQLLLEHGVAINALTASDTGWDLHCHVPDDLIRQASTSSLSSWNLSGRTAHVQVKSAPTDSLNVGTARGWYTGTMSGVPTFMFCTLNNHSVFSAPDDLEVWLDIATRHAPDTGKHRYTLRGRSTAKQTRLGTHSYSEERFPSVLQLWVHYPQIAMSFNGMTAWMNHDSDAKDPRPNLIADLANAIWSEHGYGRHTELSQLLSPLVMLYSAAGFSDAEDLAEQHMLSGNIDVLMAGDGQVTRDTLDRAIGSFVDPQRPEESAVRLIEHTTKLHGTDATIP